MSAPRRLVVPIALLALVGCAPTREATTPTLPAIEANAGQTGLGLRVWPIRDQSHALARTLHDAPEAPIAPATRRMLRDAGLRIVAVPSDQLEAIHARLPAGGPTQRQWLRSVPAWHEATSGPRTGATRVMLDNGPLALDAGRARLMIRAWVEPTIGPGADGRPVVTGRMHLELVPEHVMEVTSPAQRLEGRRPRQDRLVFDRLVARWNASPGVAYLVVGEQPGADWAKQAALADEPTTLARIVPEAGNAPPVAGPAEPDEHTTTPGQTAPSPDAVASPGQPSGLPPGQDDPDAGPQAVPTLTLGEMILGSRAYAGVPAPVRRVLVLVPVAPARYTLVP